MTEAQWALVQMLDGVQRHDLPNQLGLPDDEIDRIWSAYESARADLAQPALPAEGDESAVPEGREPASVVGEPSDAELESFLLDVAAEHGDISWAEPLVLARAVLARWGRLVPTPVPVSERLPGPEDCDAEKRCWLLTVEDEYPQWRLHSIEGNQPGGATMIWVPVDSSPGVMVDCFYTSHWLPAHALPLPAGEVE